MAQNHRKRRGRQPRKYTSPYKIYGIIIGIVVVLVTGFLWQEGAHPLLAYMIAVNIATLVLFGFDKAIAGSRTVRVPEKVLYALAFLGASPAILLGQKLFRHKTVKTSFQVMFWLIVVVQVGLIVYFYRDVLWTTNGSVSF